MRRTCKTVVLTLLLIGVFCISAQAMENDMLRVGIKYGSDAMSEANLQNYSRFGGYAFGWYDSSCRFRELGSVSADYEKITVTTDMSCHVQLDASCRDYSDALETAAWYDDAFVAYIDDEYVVRIGNFSNTVQAESYLSSSGITDGASVVSSSRTGVTVIVTGTDTILFEFDCSGLRSLGIQPIETQEQTVTWFRGYRYYGGFEYQRVTGGNINVINVVNVEDYVKCVIPWEMSNEWPLEALKAQSVCARTYAACQTKHRSQGFDVCTTTDCQVYQGASSCNAHSDSAVDSTAGKYLYYKDSIVTNAVYYSSNGGASEDCFNVWGSDVPYLKGKNDPYEQRAASEIPKYNWSTTYTSAELTALLKSRGHDIGTVKNLYVSALTDNGNVFSITFVGTKGTKTFQRETCRTLLNLRSQRFNVGSGDSNRYYVNDASGTVGLSGIYVISGSGKVAYSARPEDTYVITSNGVSSLGDKVSAASSDSFTITGSGNGHNVGLSQWGAYAMADLGYDYRDILEFYYTGVDIY